MREILFRGKRVDNGKWVYGFFNIVTKGQNGKLGNDYIITTFKKLDNGEIILTGTYSVIAETVGQYTGLTDKNGTKIFEGDIVKDEKQNIGYICFLQQEMGYVVVYQKHDICLPRKLGHRNRNSLYQCDLNLEIIGNIFDNSELINKGV